MKVIIYCTLTSLFSIGIAIFLWERGRDSVTQTASSSEDLAELLVPLKQQLASLKGSIADLRSDVKSIASSTIENPALSLPTESTTEYEKREAIKTIENNRDLLVERHESLLEQTLKDFDRAEILYQEGKIPISRIQELKRKLEETEFQIKKAKTDAERQLLSLRL